MLGTSRLKSSLKVESRLDDVASRVESFRANDSSELESSFYDDSIVWKKSSRLESFQRVIANVKFPVIFFITVSHAWDIGAVYFYYKHFPKPGILPLSAFLNKKLS